MATVDLYKNLLGYDPYERRMQEQKLWGNLYQTAQSPYERMGIALGQLGSTLFGGDTRTQTETASLNKVLTEVGSQYEVNSPEYFKAIAAALPDSMSNAKAYATQKAVEAESAATKQTRSDIEFLQKNPDQLATELQTLTTRLENRAKVLGWNPTDPLNQEVPPEIQAKLEKTPEYKKIMQLSTAGQTAIMDREQKEKKEALTIESLETTIKKNKKELAEIGDKFDAGTRWNYERQAAIDTLAASGYQPTDKLQGADQLNTALVSAQKVALRQPWVGAKQPAGGWSATVKPAPNK
jgi:hypothetical protein